MDEWVEWVGGWVGGKEENRPCMSLWKAPKTAPEMLSNASRRGTSG